MKHTTRAGALASVALLLAQLVFAADTVTSVPVSPKVNALQSGRAAIAAKDWQKAITHFTLAVQQEPRNADARNLLAYSYRKQAMPDLPKAFEHYNMALQLDPKHKGAHEYIGEAYLMDKQPAEAEKHLALLADICGNKTCEAYVDLAQSIAQYKQK